MTQSNPSQVQASGTAWLRGPDDPFVRVGEMGIVRQSGHLEVSGLGCSVAVILTGPGFAGIVHPAFPTAITHRSLAISRPHLFADEGVKRLLAAAAQAGLTGADLHASLVGGGRLEGASKSMDLGIRTGFAAESALLVKGVPIAVRSLGRHAVRRVVVHADGRLFVDDQQVAA